VLDLLVPPYCSGQARDCTYYARVPGDTRVLQVRVWVFLGVKSSFRFFRGLLLMLLLMRSATQSVSPPRTHGSPRADGLPCNPVSLSRTRHVHAAHIVHRAFIHSFNSAVAGDRAAVVVLRAACRVHRGAGAAAHAVSTSRALCQPSDSSGAEPSPLRAEPSAEPSASSGAEPSRARGPLLSLGVERLPRNKAWLSTAQLTS
jgi:hypothetical protein